MAIKVSFNRKKRQPGPLPEPIRPNINQPSAQPESLPEMPVTVQEQVQQEEVSPVQEQETPQLSHADQYLNENKRPEQSDYHEGADFLKTLLPPLTKEEIEKRKRGAMAVETIGHLGNIISSFANLVNVGKGGLSLKLPAVPTGNIDAWEERMRGLQERYAGAGQKAAAMDRTAYQNALNVWLKGYSNAQALDLKEADQKRRALKDAADLQLKREAQELKKEAQQETARHNKAGEGIANRKATAYINRINGGGGSSEIRIPRKDGGYDIYNKNDLNNEAVISSIYQKLPDEYKVKETNVLLGTLDENNKLIMPNKDKVNKTEMTNAIMKAVNDGKLDADTFDNSIRVGTKPEKKTVGLGWGRNSEKDNKLDW